MPVEGFDWEKNEMRIVWTFTALVMYLWMSWMTGGFFVPAEWFFKALVDSNLSFSDSYIMDLKEGLAEAQRILHDGK